MNLRPIHARRAPGPVPARRRLAALAMALPLLVAVPSRAADSLLPSLAQRTLGNGLRVVVAPDPDARTVELVLRVPAGIDAEPAGKNGLAAVVARLVGRSTITRDAAGMAGELAALGTTLDADVGHEETTVRAVARAAAAENLFALFGDAVANPLFSPPDVERATAAAARSLLQSHADPRAVADEQVWPHAHGDHTSARPLGGTLGEVLNLDLEDVRGFHRARWRPRGAVLVVSGDVTPERAFALAEEWFGRWSGEAGVVPPPPPPGRAGVRIIDRAEVRIAELRLAWHLAGRGGADDAARSLAVRRLDEALKRRFGRPGRAGADARAALQLSCGSGLLVVAASAPPESVGVVVQRLRAEVRRVLAETPAAASLPALRRGAEAGLLLNAQTPREAMAQWLSGAGCGLPDDWLDRYRERLASATPATVAGALKGVEADRAAVLVVGPAPALRRPLAPLGTAEVVRLDQPPSPATAVMAPATPAEVERGRALVERALVAHGGRERLARLRDSWAGGEIEMGVQGRLISGGFIQIRKEPDKMVYKLSLIEISSRQVLDGSKGWTDLGDGAVRAADSAGVAALRATFRSDVVHILLDAADPAAKVAARGSARVDTSSAERVEVLTAAGELRTLLIETAAHRLVALDQAERVAGAGQVASRRHYRDHRMVDGVLWPFEEERQIEGQPFMRIRVKELRLDQGVDDREFEPAGAGR